jgi:1,4-alpha-glucan branching enzyme
VQDYRLNFPAAGEWHLRFDSHYGGYDASFEGQVSADVIVADDSQKAAIAIAPYSAIIYSQY